MPDSIQQHSAKKALRVLIAAGGTGGHVYPAISIADALKEQHAKIEILFVGTSSHMEWQAVPEAGYPIKSIWISGLHRRLTLKNLLFPFKLATSLAQSWQIISSFQPDVMICCGGYAAGPIGWVAAKRNIALFIQEQNSFPGVTNRLLGRYAEQIFTAFKEASSYFPPGKTHQLGNPTRESLTKVTKEEARQHFGFISTKKTLLVLGGSGGAKSINQAVQENLSFLHDQLTLQIIWQCGKRYVDELRSRLNIENFSRLRLVDFIHQMPAAYAVADIVISRAGALSCAELALTGNASILVPSPNVAGDHQTKNALAMMESGAARIVKDEEADVLLPTLVEELLYNQKKIKEMQQAALKQARPNAAKEIANEILHTVNEQKKKR